MPDFSDRTTRALGGRAGQRQSRQLPGVKTLSLLGRAALLVIQSGHRPVSSLIDVPSGAADRRRWAAAHKSYLPHRWAA
jgi:hypothetical protein